MDKIGKNAKKVDLVSIVSKEKWSTYFDVQNKLVIYVTNVLCNLHVDYSNDDPDGIPLVWVERLPVTRVRKMTEKEYEDAMKEFTANIVRDGDSEVALFRVISKDVLK
jgi:hypothetical protein